MTGTELEVTRTELEVTRTELESTAEQLSHTNAQLEVANIRLDEVESELADLQVAYEGLMTGHGYTINDPTYKEMLRFLRRDDTDKQEYREGEYECRHFALDMCNNAEEEGIRCAYVLVEYPGDVGHAIVAFNTIDEGLIYIEPQFDELLEGVEIGERFHDCLGSGFEKPDYDDTIESILVVW